MPILNSRNGNRKRRLGEHTTTMWRGWRIPAMGIERNPDMLHSYLGQRIMGIPAMGIESGYHRKEIHEIVDERNSRNGNRKLVLSARL